MAWPLIAAAGVAAVGAIVGGIINANASAAAAEKQKKAADEALAFEHSAANQQRKIYDQQRADMMPWMDAGRTSLSDLMSQMQSGSFNTQLDPSQLAQDPGYQFRMAEGQKALERGASSRGMLASGGAMKSLDRYSQGLASDEYQNAFARQQSENAGRFGRLSSMAGMGQNAGQSIGTFGAQLGQNIGQSSGRVGDLMGAIGNAQAAGIIGQGNAMAGMVQGIGNAGASALGGMYGGGMGGNGAQIPQQGGQMPQQRGGYFGPAYGGGNMYGRGY